MAKRVVTGEQARRRQEKKAANERLAALRFERLQAQQRAEKEAKAMKPRLDKMYADMDEYVSSAINGKFGPILNKWLAGRQPKFELVLRFFNERMHLWAVPPQDPVLRVQAEAAILKVNGQKKPVVEKKAA